MAVTKIEGLPGRHHCGSWVHLISKHAPQLNPLLNRAVLSAAVFTPYPWEYRFPYPHAPPTKHDILYFIFLTVISYNTLHAIRVYIYVDDLRTHSA